MSREQTLTRGCPNGATRPDNIGSPASESIGGVEPTRGTEPSKYPQEEKANAIPPVAASEKGTAQTGGMFKFVDVVSSV